MSVPPQVLIVDDDASIRSLYEDILRAEEYSVATAGTGADAIGALERLGGIVDVLVLDIGLPDADGANVAKEIVARIGHRPTLYVSGWADEFSDLAEAPGRWLVMQKPIPVPSLIAAIDWLSAEPVLTGARRSVSPRAALRPGPLPRRAAPATNSR
jgi:DNA-binding response OmpR family regulator